jgi:hypothetical protein
LSQQEQEEPQNKKPLTKKKKKKKEQARKSRKRSVLRNRRYVDTYKEQNPCPCGITETCCLSFHHEKGEKSGNISDMVNKGYGIARIQKEMDKCIVLCLNCHAVFHNGKKENENN